MAEELTLALERAQRRLRGLAPPESPAVATMESFLAERREPTRSAYRHDLEAFAVCLRRRGVDLLRADPEDVAIHMAELRQAGVRPATVRRRLAAIAGLYRHARGLGVAAGDPLNGVRRPRDGRASPTQPMRPGGLPALVGAAGTLGIRDRALVLLLAQAGLRLGEALTLDVENLLDYGEERILLQVRSRSRGDRELILPEASAQACRELIERRRSGPLLITSGGRRLDRRHALRIVTRLGRRTGRSDAITPRSVRQTFIAHALAAGVDRDVVAAAVGLSDPRTLRRYEPQPRPQAAREVPLRLAAH